MASDVVFLSGDLLELVFSGGQGALGSDHRRGSRVARRLGFLNVGDGDETYVVPLIRLVELPGDRLQRGLLRFQIVQGRQHIEVGLRDSQDEVLLGGNVGGLRLRHLAVGLPSKPSSSTRRTDSGAD